MLMRMHECAEAHGLKMAETRVTICDFEGRKRPVTFPTSIDSRNLVAAAECFSDVISCENEDSDFVQVESEKHRLIDVMGSTGRVAENETVFLRYWKHPGDEVSYWYRVRYFIPHGHESYKTSSGKAVTCL